MTTTLKEKAFTVASIGCGIIAGGLAAKAAFEISERCGLDAVPTVALSVGVGTATYYAVADSLHGTMELIDEKICK